MGNSFAVSMLLVGVLLGILLSLILLDSADNKMCGGKPKVVQTADTVRTFTCTVELKKGDNND